MPIFVDHVGLNSVVNDELNTETNTKLGFSKRTASEILVDKAIRSQQADGGTGFGCITNLSVTGYSSNQPITIAMWVKMDGDDFGTAARYLMHAQNGSQDILEIFITNGDQLAVRFYQDGSNHKTYLTTITNFVADRVDVWFNLIVSWSGNFANPPEIFIDGFSGYLPVFVQNTTGNPTTFPAIEKLAFLDKVLANPAFELGGSLQTITVYNRRLSYSPTIEPNLIYNNGIPRDIPYDDTNVIDHWSFNQLGNPATGSFLATGTVISASSYGTNNLTCSSGGNLSVVAGTLSENPTGTGTFQPIGFPAVPVAVEEFAALNTHRNGPYGYSSWTQLRASENPITRYHKANNTLSFVVQPGPIRNVLANGEFRVKDRYSKLYSFTEPAIAQKAYPLVWNVGRHVKDENGNIDFNNPQKFSIISSFSNQLINFANKEVNELLKVKSKEDNAEYFEIYKLYADGGLNSQKSPLSYWEFLQYRETVWPHMKNQFQNENLERPNFKSFYRTRREDRVRTLKTGSVEPFGWPVNVSDYQSSPWPLDVDKNFLTRNFNIGTNTVYNLYKSKCNGVLTSKANTFSIITTDYAARLTSSADSVVQGAIDAFDSFFAPYPIYARRHALQNIASVSNPSGLSIPQTGSIPINTASLFEGNALWEAGDQREVKDSNGNYISAPRQPFYDSYEGYIEEARRFGKNYSVVPEFRMSTQVEDYIRNPKSLELDIFDVTGGAANAQNSSQSDFYKIYSNSDFMREFELIDRDHEEFTNGRVLSLRCKAIKKFLPYEGFYPCQRTVDLAKQFYDSYGPYINTYNAEGNTISGFNYGKSLVAAPLFGPGILFNSIRSGVAVDYPVISGSLFVVRDTTHSDAIDFKIKNNSFGRRIPFEALVEPADFLAGENIPSMEPHLSGNLSASAYWGGTGDQLYTTMMNNFLAEIPEFFLPNGNFSAVASKKQGAGILLDAGVTYGMRVFMKRSYDKERIKVYHSGRSDLTYLPPQDIILTGDSAVRETFTMYSRPSAFGPPTHGTASYNGAPLNFDEDRFDGGSNTIKKDSSLGYNFPFTPPYYHGEAWCDIVVEGTGEVMTIEQIQSASTYNYTRFDDSFYTSPDGRSVTSELGPQRPSAINKNALQLSASLNLRSVGTISNIRAASAAGNFVVDTGLDQDNRWIIQTKFESPMLNFNHISHENNNITLPTNGPEVVPRGLWHQYGRIPEENEGVYMGVKAIETNWQKQVLGKTDSTLMQNLAAKLGFSGKATKIGRIRPSKKIHEAVVAVPFIVQNSRKKFFRLDEEKVNIYKTAVRNGSDTLFNSLITGDPQSQIGRTLLKQMQKMEKYIFPPSFDFINYDDVDPIAMYIFEFSHTLSQQDLSDIWQNLPPDIGTEMEVVEVAITHPLLKKELLGEGGAAGNTLIDMPHELKWMVFKVKQRAASNYFKKTIEKNPDLQAVDIDSNNNTTDEFGESNTIQYNWPYDFFSLVELVKIDAEVEFGNFTKEAIENYTESIPPWDAVTAEPEQVEATIAGMEDDIVPDSLPAPTEDQKLDTGSDEPDPQSGAGNAFLAERQEQLDATIDQIQANIAGRMAQEQDSPLAQPGGMTAMVGELDEAAGAAGGITGVLGGALEEFDEGDGNDSAQGGSNNNTSGLSGNNTGGGNNPGGIV